MRVFSARLLPLAALLFARVLYAAECPQPPEPMKDIKAQGYYEDRAGSIVDEAKRRENAEMTKPLDDYLKQVTTYADAYLADPASGAGGCAVAWLDGWAQGGAMLGEMVHVNNDQSDYMRAWTHGGLAVAWLKVKKVATDAQRAEIETWLTTIAKRDLAYWDNPKKHRNNHYYWTGVGVTATAVATGDQWLMDKARTIYATGIDAIEADGSLPMEMERAAKAMHYHNYALEPLVLMAQLGQWAGENWFGARDHKIDLLAERVAASYADSSWFVERTGKPQDPLHAKSEAGWVVFYLPHAKKPELFQPLLAAGPFVEPRMGGDLGLMARAYR